MAIGSYLPSAKLISIVGSLALSAVLVFAADAYTHRAQPTASVNVGTDASSTADTGWEAALYAIQAQTASSTFDTPDPNFVNNLLTAAQSQNVTDTIGKTLLINLSNAKSQGLGNDIPTQDQIIAAAASQVNSGKNLTLYKTANLTIVSDNSASLRAYGNGVMRIFNSHPGANQNETFMVIGTSVDNSDSTELKKLIPIKAAYGALTSELLALPVPQTLAPFHLLLVNDFVRITGSYDDMQAMITDPLRGLAGFQTYQSSLSEGSRVFTNIAQALSKDGILFTKDEPGAAWSAFVSQ